MSYFNDNNIIYINGKSKMYHRHIGIIKFSIFYKKILIILIKDFVFINSLNNKHNFIYVRFIIYFLFLPEIKCMFLFRVLKDILRSLILN